MAPIPTPWAGPSSINPIPPRLAAAALASCVTAGGASGHPVETPLGYTGGFGEPTCVECHAGYALNPPEGGLRLSSDREVFKPGRMYRLILNLTDPDMRRAGFELAARYTIGARRGKNAGRLGASDKSNASESGLRLSTDARGVQFLLQESGGSQTYGAQVIRWEIPWRAPAKGEPQCTVIFHAAANAADDDESAFGDRVYTASLTLRPKHAGPDCGADSK